ncbi:hypothetical protein [Pseudaeromonas paramecii]|uniref:Uncharacterized protein n=1 Tax=Pseudaeromonas paramecii TaxID=2138166 RepID=A0ABP8QD45_9GAMM
MNLSDLEESHLLSLTYDHNGLFIEFILLSSKDMNVKLFAHNKDTSPITVKFIGLNIRSNFTTPSGVASLGEVEAVQTSKNGFDLEGDMGFIQVVADTLMINDIL